MSRALIMAVAFLALCHAPTVSLSLSSPAANSCYAVKTATLKEQLEKGLKARRPEEFEFIAQVVKLVDRKTLQRKLVDGTFLWARRKPRHQFQYFEKAMRLRAKREGVILK